MLKALVGKICEIYCQLGASLRQVRKRRVAREAVHATLQPRLHCSGPLVVKYDVVGICLGK